MATARDYEATMNGILAAINELPTEADSAEGHTIWQRSGGMVLGAWAGMNGFTHLETLCQTFSGLLAEDGV